MYTAIMCIVTMFMYNFEEHINLGDEVKSQLLQGLNKLPLVLGNLVALSLLLFVINLFLVTNQMFWHTLLDSSWCNNNFYNREKANKDKIVTD